MKPGADLRIGSRFVLYDYSSILDFRSELCYTIHNTLTWEMIVMTESPRCSIISTMSMSKSPYCNLRGRLC